MADEFRADNGGTMFLPGSHRLLRPPDVDPFARPPDAALLQAPAGHVGPRPKHAHCASWGGWAAAIGALGIET